MLFNSLTFVVFFGTVFLLYYTRPSRRVQVPVLVVASFIYYAWAWWKPAVLLAFAILLNGWVSYRIWYGNPNRIRVLATFAVIANISILVLCKYAGLLFNSLVPQALSGEPLLRLFLNIPLPVGISFFTFESVSLVVDSWRQHREPNPWVRPKFGSHLLGTALFVSFFPHLIAGPILKAREFIPQIGQKRIQDVAWESALANLITGYFLKMVVADNLKEVTAFLTPPFGGLQSADLLFMLFGFSIQIFADFAGYSLIAIGLAELLGYRLVQNFNYPYVARSLSEFWQRWHISLSSWLKNYLYIPLGGNRHGTVRTMANLLLVMLIGGLWHGAAWSFAVWGLIHGAALALERLTGLAKRPSQGILESVSRILWVFSIVTAAWVFFKLTDFNHALGFFSALAKPPPGEYQFLARHYYTIALSIPVVAFHLASLKGFDVARARTPWLHALMLAMIVLNSGESGSFIYFRF